MRSFSAFFRVLTSGGYWTSRPIQYSASVTFHFDLSNAIGNSIRSQLVRERPEQPEDLRDRELPERAPALGAAQ